MNINAEGIKETLKIVSLSPAEARERLKNISGQIKLKSFLTIKRSLSSSSSQKT